MHFRPTKALCAHGSTPPADKARNAPYPRPGLPRPSPVLTGVTVRPSVEVWTRFDVDQRLRYPQVG
jgi:hypothetical protein